MNMKKIFIAALALAAVAACNKAEVIETAPGEVIAFGDAFVDNATKADYSSTDIKEFKVYGEVNGVNIFDGDNVTKGDAAYGAAWTCDGGTQYWIDGAAYNFAAVVDADAVTVNEATGMPVSLTYAAAGQKDMLYNKVAVKGKKTGNAVVAFTFSHLLAKAYFTVTNNVPDTKYTYTVSDVKVTNAYQNGVYTTADGDWAGSNAAATSFATITDVANGTPKTNAEMLFIPEASVGVSFKVTLSIDGKEVTSYDFSEDAVVTLAANNVYNFDIKLSLGEEIQFTVTEQPEWTTPTTGVEL